MAVNCLIFEGKDTQKKKRDGSSARTSTHSGRKKNCTREMTNEGNEKTAGHPSPSLGRQKLNRRNRLWADLAFDATSRIFFFLLSNPILP